MSSLDDLPKHDKNRELDEESKSRFRTAISDGEHFVVQSVDDSDYGVDFWIEARDGHEMTNVRVAVQLKGTRCDASADGTVSRSVKRTTLNYLAMHAASVFVCYHAPSNRLLVRRVDDVLREYEHRAGAWSDQSTVTVRFRDAFSLQFQERLKEHAIASARGARDRRHQYATLPPDRLAGLPEEMGVDLPVPADAASVEALLAELYRRGQDRTISCNFDKFYAVLGTPIWKLSYAYMAEINLGVNGHEVDRARVAKGIEVLQDATDGGVFSPGSMLYCVGNGWLALGDYRRAAETYEAALELLEGSDCSGLAAMCCKNFGAAKAKLGDIEGAHVLYRRALKFDAGLAEAHYALALSYRRSSGGVGELERALEHFDAIVCSGGSALAPTSVQGWRAEVLFELGRTGEAFREIRTLQGRAQESEWVLPWCARLVATYGRVSVEAARHALRFWDTCASVPLGGTVAAEREKLLCVYQIHASGGQTPYNYGKFRRSVEQLVERDVPDPAFLWDRCGHWAQDDGDWVEAEECYRRAFDLSADEYGYCFGTALNFLGRYDEALPVLLVQAQEHQPDALSWFQVGVARAGVGDVEGAVAAYRRAVELEEDYDRAWFNLGGVYWNSGRVAEAKATWREAVRRFPAHEKAKEIRENVPGLSTG